MKAKLIALIERLKIRKRHIKYIKYFKKLMRMQHLPNEKGPGEDAYIAYWKQITPSVEPYSYRFFRHYCGETPYIVPEDIGHSYIEPKLNPRRFTPFYEDKNMLPLLLPAGAVPETYLCRMQGGQILNNKMSVAGITKESSAKDIYEYLRGKMVILKLSLDSSSGRNIMKFVPKDNRYVSSNSDETILDGEFLIRYGKDWVLQEALSQHQYISQFCSSSVNTMRICTYRSVKDEQVYLTAAAIRIGHQGSVVDNLHAGGGFVGIEVATGNLMHEVFDQYGNRTETLNGINFKKGAYAIPNWEQVCDFSKRVAAANRHCRLIALDVALTEDGTPKLIEWNVTPYSFSYWIPMMIGVTPFGDKTEEIVEYVLGKLRVNS